MDKITVISQSTSEREEETRELFEKCKVFLKQGYTLNQSVQKVKGLNYHSLGQRAWYKELKEYAKSQGYGERYYE